MHRFVASQSVSRQASLSTNITWMGDAADVNCFNVALYRKQSPLLSTHLADSRPLPFVLMSFGLMHKVLTQFHHCLDIIVQLPCFDGIKISGLFNGIV